MPKVTKKSAKSSKDEAKKKNPILDDEEDTADEAEETTENADDETTDEEVSEDEADDVEDDEDIEEEKPKAKAKAKSPAKSTQPIYNADQGLKSDIAHTKAILDAEEKVRFYVPLFEGEKAGSIHQCFINGYMFPVKKGVMTEVPITIATLLADHYKITAEAGANFRLDLNEKKSEALS